MAEHPNHFLLFREPDGTTFDRANDFLSLTCRLGVNRIHRLQVEWPGDHDVLANLEDRVQVELWRRVPEAGLDWHRFFSGLYRPKLRRQRSPANRAAITCLGDNYLLKRRTVAWAADTADRSAFTSKPAETIAKALVTHNLTSAATEANGRIEDGDDWPASLVTVEADGGGGTTRDWFCANDNLLETLQKLALVGGGDWDLVKADLDEDPLGWEFRWYEGQLGTDRSATLTFAVGRDNMLNPVYVLDSEDEATVAIVGGQGEGADRAYQVAYGANYSADNHIEMFVNGSSVETDAGLIDLGERRLAERRAREEFSFTAKQTENCIYGRDWSLGDLARAVNPWTGADSVVKVNSVTLVLREDGQQIITGEVATP